MAASKMDPRRVFLGYLFFSLGLALTFYQYSHLILRGGPMQPWLRQFGMMFVNTLAISLGGLLVIPWHAEGLRRGGFDYEGRPHFQWMMAISLIFCFFTMLGLAVALILGPTQTVTGPSTATMGSDLFGDVNPANVTTVFPWSSYAIAAFYMLGYGILGVGPKIARWALRQATGQNDSNADAAAEPQPPKPKAVKKVYPIETRFVVGRVRQKRQPKTDPNDTAQD